MKRQQGRLKFLNINVTRIRFRPRIANDLFPTHKQRNNEISVVVILTDGVTNGGD
jgi:hypothetical protein